ncbi:MAG: 2Fe-2S iron-sulfur cluster binding domain-containing protein, partial [bacterium]|nr:2Fe-2S iron-sulfur cluster binding domain-containing protein [bacterium]
MNKYQITIQPGHKTLQYRSGTLLLDILTDQGIPVKTPCGGKGICGKCLVEAAGTLSKPDAEELKTIRDKPGKRLSCVTRVEGEVSIRIEEDMGANKKALLISPGELTEYGIAVDIGTTTVQVSLVDLKNQKSWLIDSFLNPQRRYGHDIIARISAAAEKETAKQISTLVRGKIISSIERALSIVDLEPAGIGKIVFSGNTAMTYFLFGLDPAPLGVFPYTASNIDYENYTGSDIGFNLKNNADIYALPAASSYLGGDLVGGLALL